MDYDDTMYVAHYENFYVASEDSKYRLSLSGYNNHTSFLPDAFLKGGHSNAQFRTQECPPAKNASGNEDVTMILSTGCHYLVTTILHPRCRMQC